MTARILDGNLLSTSIKDSLTSRIENLKKHNLVPGLTVILVGDDPASAVYVNKKAQTFTKLGLNSQVLSFPADISSEFLQEQIEALNNDPQVHGILVQLPLPKHLDSFQVIESIDPAKDVDGFHRLNAGALMVGKPNFIPCTPYGIMKMLESANITLRGAQAVVVGASNIVGKPIALLLQQAGATVTICNSKTRDLVAHTSQADILVVATGRPKMITAEMVKAGAVVIDVGINRQENGKLCGDVDFDSVQTVASAITPVPGGVGPMTITMLLVNTIEAAEKLLP